MSIELNEATKVFRTWVLEINNIMAKVITVSYLVHKQKKQENVGKIKIFNQEVHFLAI